MIKLINGLVLITVVSFISPVGYLAQAANQRQVFEYIEISSRNWEGAGTTIRIDKNKEVVYTLIEAPGMSQQAEGQVKTFELENLISLLEKASLYSLKNEYNTQLPFDKMVGRTYSLTMETDMGIKTISFYYKGETDGAFPKILLEIVNKIKTMTKNIAKVAFKTESQFIE